MSGSREIITTALLILVWTGCPADGGGEVTVNRFVDSGPVTVAIGESKTVTMDVQPGNANERIVWKSADKKIAAVAGGGTNYVTVTGVAVGATVITGSGKQTRAMIQINVTDKADEEGVTLSDRFVSLTVGEQTVVAIVRGDEIPWEQIVYSIEPEGYAVVKGNEVDGPIVQGITTGEGILRAKYHEWEVTIPVEVTMEKLEDLLFTETEINTERGNSEWAALVITPAGYEGKVTYRINDTEIAKIGMNDKNGCMVMGKSVGEAALTAVAGGKMATVGITVKGKITVTPAEVRLSMSNEMDKYGQLVQMSLEGGAAGDNKLCTWQTEGAQGVFETKGVIGLNVIVVTPIGVGEGKIKVSHPKAVKDMIIAVKVGG